MELFGHLCDYSSPVLSHSAVQQQQRLHYSADVYIIPVKWETGADQQQSRTTEEELEKH